VPGTSIPSVVATELTRLKPGRIIILGGTSVVSAGVQTALAAYLPS
jgi:putative cell wall-binding protein